MLALIYLALAISLGDLLCQRFYRFVSVPHRWAAATWLAFAQLWLTYLAGLALPSQLNLAVGGPGVLRRHGWRGLLFCRKSPRAE
jgi:hypothetical protein